MYSRCASNAKRKREKRPRTNATTDAVAGLIHADPAKFRVMIYLRRLVAHGYAEWHTIENGDTRLRFQTGETYLLAKTTITRIA